ncbi:cobalt-precorrin-5B (C(1))-methyltransferase [Alkalihalobacterium chitinilyticum]|uniref:Cobalt-precorrin-5B C(1)-methyltransferase n=1 Tax=Alkalihalobacterium chitinilyticum TaxID=2980103 RepID=A0ABT5V9M9_9BACI|nr:cobalt-precorrin-5B (C(1))-methyltransferase [Alkalihalobacterium chitinilyticum]MDE5412164.1 cobalt-precorrin-5B (C(1))-methyltransferase [Alkalihalobacterium chitinilyticum]
MKKKVEKDPKDMRHGYTTGANATAATKAALLSLLLQKEVRQVSIRLPVGEVVTFNMENVRFNECEASATIIKDGGDDPDATHGAQMIATVQLSLDEGIHLDGGIGVGRVTKPGLPVAVGEAAINPVPRKMIIEAAIDVLEKFSLVKGVSIIISVPDGEEIAKKTLNGRLGIIGGISILGTRGTVVPFSTSAFKASIAQAIQVAVTNGCDHLFLTTGGRSEKFAIETHPEAKEEAFIEMGDFVGFALKQCKAKKVKKITLVGMMGKFSKVAQGIMMVHSKSAPVDFNFLAEVAKEAGVPTELQEEIRGANTASQVGTLMLEYEYHAFFSKLCLSIGNMSLKEIRGGLDIEVYIISMNKEVLGREVVVWDNPLK